MTPLDIAVFAFTFIAVFGWCVRVHSDLGGGQ